MPTAALSTIFTGVLPRLRLYDSSALASRHRPWRSVLVRPVFASLAMGLALVGCGGGDGGAMTNNTVASGNSSVLGAGATGAGSATGSPTAPATTTAPPMTTTPLKTTAIKTETPNTTGNQPGTYAANPAGGSPGDQITTTQQVSVSIDANGLKGSYPATARLKNGGYAIAWVSEGQGICTRTYAANATPAGVQSCIEYATTGSGVTQKPAVAGLAGGGYVVAYVPEIFSTKGIDIQRFDDAGVKVGPGQTVSTSSSNTASEATVAVLECGDFVVGWTSTQQLKPFNVSDIYARRYTADGVAVSVPQRVNTFVGEPITGSRRTSSAVAAVRDGGYVFIWTSEGQTGNGSSLYKQRFDAGGVPVGSETLVSASIDSNYFIDNVSSIAGLSGGGHVITWNFNLTVIAQQFNADGSQTGAAAAVEPLPPVDPTVLCDRGSKNAPGPCLTFQNKGAPAALDDGGYVIAYAFGSQLKANEPGIYARRFSADGTPTAPSQRISSMGNATMSAGSSPAASGVGNGGFVIAWWTIAFQPAGVSGIYARTFDSRGF